MAELHELIEKIENPELRAQIAEAAKRALKTKSRQRKLSAFWHPRRDSNALHSA